jgi:hypothetical protein
MSKRSGSVSWMLLLLVTGLSLAAAWLPRLPLRAGTTLAAEEEAMRAQYAAESGAVRALEELKRSGTIDPAGYTWELDGAAVRVTGTKDGKEYRIRTEGESARKHVLSRLLLTCVVEKKDNGFQVEVKDILCHPGSG